MKRVSLIAAMLASTAIMAQAGNVEPVVEEVIVVEPVIIAPFWAGGYIGAQLGYAYSDFSLDDIGDFDTDSVIGGITLGYLWSVGSGWYLGPEFQYDFANLTVQDEDTGAGVELDQIGRLKLIVGYELGNGMLYGSAGAAYASLDGISDVTDTIGDVFGGDEFSYVLGIGYDWRVADNWSIGAEYQYHDFRNVGDGSVDVNLNTIHLKAAYRF
jgi:outer membrane immunogenic protein